MKIACVSDTHGMWQRKSEANPSGIEYPEADVLILAGDILANYSRERTYDANLQLKEVEKLDDHFSELKSDGLYDEIVLIAGNHDFCYQKNAIKTQALILNAHYLQDSQVELSGVKFWGSPWQPWFWDWAFNFPNHYENPAQARAHARGIWGLIPDDTNVLITHGPQQGILDRTASGMVVGCQYLRDRINELDLKLHVFGHIHESYGQKSLNGLTKEFISVNASACNLRYKPVNPIQVVEIK